jgi:hypothetical protein
MAAGVAGWASGLAVKPHPIALARRRRLADRYNDKLRRALGIVNINETWRSAPPLARTARSPLLSLGVGTQLVYGHPVPDVFVSWWPVESVSVEARLLLMGASPAPSVGSTLRLGSQRFAIFFSHSVGAVVNSRDFENPFFLFNFGISVRLSALDIRIGGGALVWKSCWENDPDDVYIEICDRTTKPGGSLSVSYGWAPPSDLAGPDM